MGYRRWTPQFIREFLAKNCGVTTIRDLNDDQAEQLFKLMLAILTGKARARI